MASKKTKDTKDKDKKESGSEPKTPDNSKEKMIPKHRFDEVNAKLKEVTSKLEVIEKEKSEAEDEQLKKQKKFEELSEKYKEQAQKAENQLKEEKINNSILAEAQKAGIKDLDAALKLIDRSDIKVDDDNEISGVSEAVNNLVETKAYLKDADAEPNLGGGSNPPDSSSQPTITKFRLSQLQDHKFYTEHEEEIKKAMTIPGAIVDDVGVETPGMAGGEPPSPGTSEAGE